MAADIFEYNTEYRFAAIFQRVTLTGDVNVPLPDMCSSQPGLGCRNHFVDGRQSRVMHHTVTFTELDGSHPATSLATTNSARFASRSLGWFSRCRFCLVVPKSVWNEDFC